MSANHGSRLQHTALIVAEVGQADPRTVSVNEPGTPGEASTSSTRKGTPSAA